MNMRPFGMTDMEVSEIGLGAWAIGGSWGEEVSEGVAIETLLEAFDQGINFVDTAAVYGDGRSERLIGEALKRTDRRIHVATKIRRGAYRGDDYGEMEALVKEQRDRLGVEVIDVIQLHCEPFEKLRQGAILENLEKLRANGLVRYTGASVESIEEALFVMENAQVDALQVIFNLFRQRLVEELFPELRNRVTAIIARVPLASGVLTGKFHRDYVFEESDHRNFNRDGEAFNVGETFAGVPFENAVELAKEAEEIFRDHRRAEPPGQLALRWILDFTEVTTVIAGVRNVMQVTDNARSAYLNPLSPELHTALKNWYATKVDTLVRGPYSTQSVEGE